MTEIKKYFEQNKDDKNVSCMMKIVHAISSAGGKARLRDTRSRCVNYQLPKGRELATAHLSTIENLLFELSGSPALKKGSSFGVYGIKGYDFDSAMPRKEHCIGSKHTDFAVSVDRYLKPT